MRRTAIATRISSLKQEDFRRALADLDGRPGDSKAMDKFLADVRKIPG